MVEVSPRLIDRSISQETAQKYGVKVMYNADGTIAQHLYPFYINGSCLLSRLDMSKIRDLLSREHTDTGLFGQVFSKKVVSMLL